MEVGKINTLINSGASISKEKLNILKKFIIDNSDKNIINILKEIMDEFENITYQYLSSGVISDISSSIVTNNINLNIYGKDNIKPVTEFDIASVTKLFTLILILKYIDKDIIKLDDKICDIDSNFQYLDYTILDLIKMSGLIVTDKRIDKSNNYNEALNILYDVHPINYNKSINNYTDIGFMVLSKVLEDINKQPFHNIITNFYKKYNIDINQMKDIIGNGYNDLLPHDPKARIMGTIGSAGIFINSINMDKFADNIINGNLISKNYLYKLSNKLFDKNHPNKSYGGIYIKHPLGIKKSSTPREYSKYAFSHQGYTGSCLIIDPLLKIHNNILVNAIKENKKKDENFYQYFNIYHEKIVLLTLKTYLINNNELNIKINRKI